MSFALDNSSIYEKLSSQICSEEYLASIIDSVDLKWMYQHQKISLDFIFNYILNPTYHCCDEDSYITLADILHFQPQHSPESVNAYIKARPRSGSSF